MTLDHQKRAAAEAAALLVSDGMVVGLGTGSTATHLVEALARRVNQGLRFIGIPTSEDTAAHARFLGVRLGSLNEYSSLDLAIDGADEIVAGRLHLTKGKGGALLREKLVAAAATEFIVVADESKLVDCLGEKSPIPVEVEPFGWGTTARRLEDLGCLANLRQGFETDSGNLILDCAFAPISDPEGLARALDGTVGVVEHGLFVGMATQALVGSTEGVRTLRHS